MKRFLLTIILAASLAVSAMAAGFGPITISDWRISGITPTSFTSLDGSVALTVNNNSPKYTISGISAVIYNKEGEMFIIGSADDFVIPKGRSVVNVTGHGSLSSYSALLGVLKNFSFNPSDYSIDVTATVKRGFSKAHPVTISRMPLSSILK